MLKQVTSQCNYSNCRFIIATGTMLFPEHSIAISVLQGKHFHHFEIQARHRPWGKGLTADVSFMKKMVQLYEGRRILEIEFLL